MILIQIILITIEYSAIFTFISHLFLDIKISVVTELLLVFIMFMASEFLIDKVTQPEFYYSTFSMNGEIIEKEILGENSYFPGEKKAKLYKNILYVMPAGQGRLIAKKISPYQDIENRSDYNKNTLIMCTLGNIIIFSGIGVILFNKKELK